MSTKPAFMVSLDVELGWGFINKEEDPGFHALTRDNHSGRRAIDFLIRVFEKYNVAATWAIVGHLFLDSPEMKADFKSDSPNASHRSVSHSPPLGARNSRLYYGRDIVENILSSSVEHEIGYHSFSHIDFSKCTHESAEEEMRKGVKLANDFGIKFESFVFPYNKIGHLDVLRKYGFRVYRGRCLGLWDINQGKMVQKMNGMIDQMTLALPVDFRWVQDLLEIPSSMVFSGSFPLTCLLPLRGIFGINSAIRSNKIFHVTLHPWNMLFDSIPNEFEKLLRFVSRKRDEGKISVIRMKDLVHLAYDSGERLELSSVPRIQ